jgi:hypothetical protein
MAAMTKTSILGEFRTFYTNTLRLIDGNLLARQELVIAPLTNSGDLTAQNAFIMNRMINGRFRLLVCPHIGWQDLGLELSHDRSTTAFHHSSLYDVDYAFSADERYATGHQAA